MRVEQIANGEYYLVLDKRKIISRIVEYTECFNKVKGKVRNIYLPKEFIGKKIRFKLEVIEDETNKETMGM